MKRDVDFIRTILVYIEKNANEDNWVTVGKKQFRRETNEILYHCRLIVERGLATGDYTDDDTYSFTSLTWDGHDFLDNARNSNIWKAARNAAGDLSFGVFQKVLEAAATQYALKQLGM